MPLGHRTVLLHETIELLQVGENDIVVDATLGGAGHSKEVLQKLGTRGRLYAFDADEEALTRAKDIFAHDARVQLIHSNFRNVRDELFKIGVESIDKIIFDLGWSGYQLEAGRGFSFLSDESLAMTYDVDQTLTARTIVNQWEASSIEDVLKGWGEERYAKRIAERIVAEREKNPIETARQLADIVKAAVPAAYRFGRLHPATKTFQALRIAVNDELGSLTAALEQTKALLKPNGRVAVITFHSIEDRIVKQQFRQWEEEGIGERETKKPYTASEAELKDNPRSRSAKLRVFKKF